MHLASISGGTDICACFIGGVPTLPVQIGSGFAGLQGIMFQGNALNQQVAAGKQRDQRQADHRVLAPAQELRTVRVVNQSKR